jgi:hypothetical protein
VQQVSLFARHFDKSPKLLGPEDIRAYQIYLTNERKLATGSVIIAVAALRFFYKVSLKKDWMFADVIPAPKKPQKLPVIPSPEEVLQTQSQRAVVHQLPFRHRSGHGVLARGNRRVDRRRQSPARAAPAGGTAADFKKTLPVSSPSSSSSGTNASPPSTSAASPTARKPSR